MTVVCMEEEYFTVDEIRKRLKVTRQAIYQWIEKGELQAVKVGRATRIPASALQRFLKPVRPGDTHQDDEE